MFRDFPPPEVKGCKLCTYLYSQLTTTPNRKQKLKRYDCSLHVHLHSEALSSCNSNITLSGLPVPDTLPRTPQAWSRVRGADKTPFDKWGNRFSAGH